MALNNNDSTDAAPRVAVVMSTYNGEKYVAEQLDSILAQGYSQVDIFVRDDGSPHDECRAVLQQYAGRGDITLICGENMGVVASFLSVIAAVPASYDYIALADQDDVWYPNKISRAVSVLQQKDNAKPQAYVAEYRYCDGDMHPGERSHLNKRGVGFADMLYENVTSGNTMVINRALAQRVNDAGSTGVYTHDWWLSLVASALGELTFDDFVCLDYRRTGNNASASGAGARAIMANRIKRYVQGDELRKVTEQLQRLRQLWGDELTPDKRELLNRFLDGNRASKAFAHTRLRQTTGGEVALRLLFLAGKL